mmetsp:Transcript_39668/g.73520  ORF Transcript_39668/g.73520 Transcript_39668/m.73520 type:complete len:193 (-) Transcript_39668:323-901(-)
MQMSTKSTPIQLAVEEVDGANTMITCSIAQCRREALVDLLHFCPGPKAPHAGGWMVGDVPAAPPRGSYATMEDWRNDQHQLKVDARTTRSKVGAARTMQWLVNTLEGRGFRIQYNNKLAEALRFGAGHKLAEALRFGAGHEVASGRHVPNRTDLNQQTPQQHAASRARRNEVFLQKLEDEQREAKKRRTDAS